MAEPARKRARVDMSSFSSSSSSSSSSSAPPAKSQESQESQEAKAKKKTGGPTNQEKMLAGLGMRLVAHQAGRVWNGNSDAFPLASLRANAKALRELTRQIVYSKTLMVNVGKFMTIQTAIGGCRRVCKAWLRFYTEVAHDLVLEAVLDLPMSICKRPERRDDAMGCSYFIISRESDDPYQQPPILFRITNAVDLKEDRGKVTLKGRSEDGVRQDVDFLPAIDQWMPSKTNEYDTQTIERTKVTFLAGKKEDAAKESIFKHRTAVCKMNVAKEKSLLQWRKDQVIIAPNEEEEEEQPYFSTDDEYKRRLWVDRLVFPDLKAEIDRQLRDPLTEDDTWGLRFSKWIADFCGVCYAEADVEQHNCFYSSFANNTRTGESFFCENCMKQSMENINEVVSDGVPLDVITTFQLFQRRNPSLGKANQTFMWRNDSTHLRLVYETIQAARNKREAAFAERRLQAKQKKQKKK